MALAGASCGREAPERAVEPDPGSPLREIEPPVSDQSFAPDLTADGDGALLTWLERLDGGARHRLRFARFDGEAWGEPVTIAEGADFFANWADLPGAVRSGDGSLVAHWLAKTGAETYAYSIFLARSLDGGMSWEPIGRLNDDATPTEHGFVSWLPEGDGARAFWLDGRAMESGSPMSLRTTTVGAEIGPSEILDDRVCECCSTDTAMAEATPIVVFRDRSAEELRDIASVHRTADGWSVPATVHRDGWRIEGCPVNGPEIDAVPGLAAVAWFTAAEGRPTVKLAFSTDRGASFGKPSTLDADAPLGRVAVATDNDGAWVTWLASAGDDAELTLVRVEVDGRLGPRQVIAKTSRARASGFPRLVKLGDGLGGERLMVAWVEVAGEENEKLRVRVGMI